MGNVGQTTQNTLTGERQFFGASGSPCSGVRAAPLCEEGEEAGGDDAARAGGGSSPAANTGGEQRRSPKTASASRRRRRGGEVAGPRTTTPDGGGERRRGALFSCERGAGGGDCDQADTQARDEAAHNLGSAGDVFGASSTAVSIPDISPVDTDVGHGARVSAPMHAAADAVLAVAEDDAERRRVYAIQQYLDSGEAARHVVCPGLIACAVFGDAPGARLAVARAAAAGRAAALARSAEPPTATDAPT